MTKLWNEIDLHVVAMLLMCAPVLCFTWWWLAVLLLLPQGRIYVRAFWVYPAFNQRPWTYLVANELVVVGSTAIVAGLRVGIGQLAGHA